MNLTTAALFFKCHRAAGPNCHTVEKAFRLAEHDPVLKQKASEQAEFDARIGGVIRSIHPPEDLKSRLALRSCGAGGKPVKARPQFTIPIIAAMVCGVLSIIGLFVAVEMDARAHFPGREAAEKMIETANGMTGVELEPVSSPAGQLGDWFMLHGFEDYGIPAEFSTLPAVGSRVLRLEGKPVAQIALDRHNSLIYVFRASDFNVDLSRKGEWRVFDHDGWAAALSRRNDVCSLVIFRGDRDEMQSFLHGL